MDFIFCIPILIGCNNKIRPDGDPTPRICPRCNNAAVQSAKSRMWFELCFIPLVPMSSKRVWICGICQWSIPIQPGWEPAVPNYGYQPGVPHQGQWNQGPQSGYMSPPPNSYQPSGQAAPKH